MVTGENKSAITDHAISLSHWILLLKSDDRESKGIKLSTCCHILMIQKAFLEDFSLMS